MKFRKEVSVFLYLQEVGEVTNSELYESSVQPLVTAALGGAMCTCQQRSLLVLFPLKRQTCRAQSWMCSFLFCVWLDGRSDSWLDLYGAGRAFQQCAEVLPTAPPVRARRALFVSLEK